MSATAGEESAAGEADERTLTKGEIFDVLRNQRRRFVLHHLRRTDGPVELGDLATQVAAWEYERPPEEVSSEQRKRVYTTLQQTHLSKMDEAGIVDYDADEGTITATDNAEQLSVYLEIVPGRGFPWREYYLSLGAVSCALVTALWFDVYPFVLLSDLVWASLIAVSLTLSAAVHIYRERGMALGEGERPPDVPEQ